MIFSTVISNAQIKLINSLSQKKYRKANNLFVAEGVKIVNEIVNSSLKIYTIFGLESWIDENHSRFNHSSEVNVIRINEKELKKISGLTTPNKVIAIVKIPDWKIQPNIGRLAIFLDQIKDPGNLGTIIRTADWFDIPNIFCSPDCVDAYSPKVVQSSMGSIARTMIHYCELNEIRQKYPSYHFLGATLNGSDISKTKKPQKTILVIGNESQGIRKPYLNLIDEQVSIKKTGKAESLNAGVAMGILSFFLKQ